MIFQIAARQEKSGRELSAMSTILRIPGDGRILPGSVVSNRREFPSPPKIPALDKIRAQAVNWLEC
jgi:hypothetical protein